MSVSFRLSFEFFPPKTPEGEAKLAEAQRKLAAHKPEFFSVTYGAGGSTRTHTFDTVVRTKINTGIDTAPHLSCLGHSKNDIAELLNEYQAQGVNRIVALRGDLPSGMGARAGELHYANELVAFIREQTGNTFHLEVAAYPEVHPQAASATADFDNFKKKVDAGATSAITQYFYNLDAYIDFVQRCEKAEIKIPIVPGIMPIANYANLVRFSNTCGAEIPRWICKRLEAYGDDVASIRLLGEEIVTRLCQQLIAYGVPGLHFYTLNQAEPSLGILENLKK